MSDIPSRNKIQVKPKESAREKLQRQKRKLKVIKTILPRLQARARGWLARRVVAGVLSLDPLFTTFDNIEDIKKRLEENAADYPEWTQAKKKGVTWKSFVSYYRTRQAVTARLQIFFMRNFRRKMWDMHDNLDDTVGIEGPGDAARIRELCAENEWDIKYSVNVDNQACRDTALAMKWVEIGILCKTRRTIGFEKQEKLKAMREIAMERKAQYANLADRVGDVDGIELVDIMQKKMKMDEDKKEKKEAKEEKIRERIEYQQMIHERAVELVHTQEENISKVVEETLGALYKEGGLEMFPLDIVTKLEATKGVRLATKSSADLSKALGEIQADRRWDTVRKMVGPRSVLSMLGTRRSLTQIGGIKEYQKGGKSPHPASPPSGRGRRTSTAGTGGSSKRGSTATTLSSNITQRNKDKNKNLLNPKLKLFGTDIQELNKDPEAGDEFDDDAEFEEALPLMSSIHREAIHERPPTVDASKGSRPASTVGSSSSSTDSGLSSASSGQSSSSSSSSSRSGGSGTETTHRKGAAEVISGLDDEGTKKTVGQEMLETLVFHMCERNAPNGSVCVVLPQEYFELFVCEITKKTQMDQYNCGDIISVESEKVLLVEDAPLPWRETIETREWKVTEHIGLDRMGSEVQTKFNHRVWDEEIVEDWAYEDTHMLWLDTVGDSLMCETMMETFLWESHCHLLSQSLKRERKGAFNVEREGNLPSNDYRLLRSHFVNQQTTGDEESKEWTPRNAIGWNTTGESTIMSMERKEEQLRPVMSGSYDVPPIFKREAIGPKERMFCGLRGIGEINFKGMLIFYETPKEDVKQSIQWVFSVLEQDPTAIVIVEENKTTAERIYNYIVRNLKTVGSSYSDPALIAKFVRELDEANFPPFEPVKDVEEERLPAFDENGNEIEDEERKPGNANNGTDGNIVNPLTLDRKIVYKGVYVADLSHYKEAIEGRKLAWLNVEFADAEYRYIFDGIHSYNDYLEQGGFNQSRKFQPYSSRYRYVGPALEKMLMDELRNVFENSLLPPKYPTAGPLMLTFGGTIGQAIIKADRVNQRRSLQIYEEGSSMDIAEVLRDLNAEADRLTNQIALFRNFVHAINGPIVLLPPFSYFVMKKLFIRKSSSNESSRPRTTSRPGTRDSSESMGSGSSNARAKRSGALNLFNIVINKTGHEQELKDLFVDILSTGRQVLIYGPTKKRGVALEGEDRYLVWNPDSKSLTLETTYKEKSLYVVMESEGPESDDSDIEESFGEEEFGFFFHTALSQCKGIVAVGNGINKNAVLAVEKEYNSRSSFRNLIALGDSAAVIAKKSSEGSLMKWKFLCRDVDAIDDIMRPKSS